MAVGEGDQGSCHVFISYARGDPVHDEAVRRLWTHLRSNGIEAHCDLPATAERQDWARWMQDQITRSDHVLIIGSAEYRRRSEAIPDGTTPVGRGVHWEAWLIRQEMYSRPGSAMKKYLPVVLSASEVGGFPAWLGAETTTHYNLGVPGGLENLLRVLTKQPLDPFPPLGPVPVLPPRQQAVVRPGSYSSGVGPESSGLILASAAPGGAPVTPLARLFLHFFDPHFVAEIGSGKNPERIAKEAALATRIALLSAETIFIPAASYIESNLCSTIVDSYQAIFDLGIIVLVGGEANLTDFSVAKLLQYEEGSERYQLYQSAIEVDHDTPPFRSRRESATADIKSRWRAKTEDLGPLVSGLPAGMFKELESRWAAVPTALSGRAFTPEYVVSTLFPEKSGWRHWPQLVVSRRVGSFINGEYFRSYTDELNAGVITDLTYLYSPITGTAGMDLPYRAVLRTLLTEGVGEAISKASPEQLLDLRSDSRVSIALTRALTSGGYY